MQSGVMSKHTIVGLIHNAEDNLRVRGVDGSDVSPELCEDCIAWSALSYDSSIYAIISTTLSDAPILPTESSIIVNVDQAISASVQARSDEAMPYQ